MPACQNKIKRVTPIINKKMKASEKFDNSMQEVVRLFIAWLSKNHKKYQDELGNASEIFWGEREDISPIKHDDTTNAFFNEWLMLDYPVNGYDLPDVRKKNFLEIFLSENKNILSTRGKKFSKNISKSNPSFYRILDIKKGKYVDMVDMFSSAEMRVHDVNLSNSVSKGMIIHGRHCQNENGKYIGAGSKVTFVPDSIFYMLFYMISGTMQLLKKEGVKTNMSQFLKWNSYLYYREMLAAFSGKFEV